MNLRKTSTTIFRLTIKMVVISAVIAAFYVVCTYTFEYGQKIFSEEGMAKKGEGVDVVFTVSPDMTTEGLGIKLKTNGLIEDSGLFKIQALLYELEINPGTYKFNTENSVEDIIEIINGKKYFEEIE